MEIYEQSQDMAAPPEAVFAYLSDVSNLSDYLPPISAAEDAPPDHVQLHGSTPDGDPIDSEGYYRVDQDARRMEWGADSESTYSGWLEVADAGSGASSVTVHLEFGPRSPHAEMQERSAHGRDPAEEALGATLESIRRQVEGDGEKVELPPIDG